MTSHLIVVDGYVIGALDEADDILGTVEVQDWPGWASRPSEHHKYHLDLGWVDTRPLEEIKAAAWAGIKAHRQTLLDAPIPVADFYIDGDASSKFDILGAAYAMGLSNEMTRQWRCHDNVMRNLTLAQIQQAGLFAVARTQQLIYITDDLWNQLQAAGDAEAVAAVVWPAATGE